HQCVVSSQALDELGIGRTTPDPPGGTIERGPDGEPTGLLVERAWIEAHARSLADYRDPARWGELIAARARALLADGITCVHDAAAFASPSMPWATRGSRRRSRRSRGQRASDPTTITASASSMAPSRRAHSWRRWPPSERSPSSSPDSSTTWAGWWKAFRSSR